jgi:hypothetical protein
MQYLPNAAELVQAVAEWVEGPASAARTGAERFNARVAANVLRSVERELRAGHGHHQPDREALSRFVTDAQDLSDDALLVELTGRIQAGQLSVDTHGLLEALHAYTVRKLLVTNPKYLDPGDHVAAAITKGVSS